jgi:serine/threonine protein kinase
VIEAVNSTHRDIKCENVLLRKDRTSLLGDLVLSRELSRTWSRASSLGVRTELLRCNTIPMDASFLADMYSFGMTTVELLLSSHLPTSRDLSLDRKRYYGA